MVDWQRILGHLAYVWPFIGSPWYLLKPLYEAEDSGLVPHDAVRRARLVWIENLKAISLTVISDTPEIFYVDATPTQLGLVYKDLYIALPLSLTVPIYIAELFAVIFAMYFALSRDILCIHIFSDNMGAIGTTRRLRGYFVEPFVMDILYALRSCFSG